MKIGFLTPSVYMFDKRYHDRIFAPGVLSRNLVAGLAQRGHQVFWFTAPEESPAGVTLVPGDMTLLSTDLQIRVFQDIHNSEIRQKLSLYGTKMYYELDSMTRAYNMAKKEDIQVMHMFHSFGFFAHFFEESTGVPTVYTLHDPMPTPDMLEHWIFDRFPRHRFLSISLSQQGALKEHFFDNVYNGIDMASFPFSGNSGEHLIIVGRMIPSKGHDVAIEVARRAGMPLQIASWLNDQIQQSEYYKNKIAPFVDNKNIIIHSMMQGENLASAYQKASVFIFPIQWEEPFGLVMVEAMACGTPVIAYNRGSVAEIVKDGITGFIIDPDNEDRPGKGNWVIKTQGIDGMVEAVKRIGQIDRANCRKHVEAHFTTDTMVEGYERVYTRVASAHI